MIEVTLFLTITVVLIVGFMATIAGRIGVQRYHDATESFANFMRSVYSEAINVQNVRSGQIASQNAYCTLTGQMALYHDPTMANVNPNESYPGRSGCAIYGKMISFGEDPHKIYVYDVIGEVVDFNSDILHGTSTVAGELAGVYADVFSFDADSSDSGYYSLHAASAFYSYTPEWETWIEDEDGNLFHGAVLIVRTPSSGAIRTLALKKTLPIQELINDPALHNLAVGSVNGVATQIGNKDAFIVEYLQAANDGETDPEKAFLAEQLDFCIATANLFAGVSQRNDVRLLADGHDSSAVEYVETDQEGENKCK